MFATRAAPVSCVAGLWHRGVGAAPAFGVKMGRFGGAVVRGRKGAVAGVEWHEARII